MLRNRGSKSRLIPIVMSVVTSLLALSLSVSPANAFGAGTYAITGVTAEVLLKGESDLQFVVCLEATNDAVSQIDIQVNSGERLNFNYNLVGPDGEQISTQTDLPDPAVSTFLTVLPCYHGYTFNVGAWGLSPGTTYYLTVNAIISSPGLEDKVFTTEVAATTKGGCPISAPPEFESRYTRFAAVVDENNVVLGVYSVSSGWLETNPETVPPGNRWVKTYLNSPTKTPAGPEMIYSPETDDFGWVLGTGSTASTSDLLTKVGLGKCEEMGFEVSLETEPNQGTCAVTDGQVQGLSPGWCPIDVNVQGAVSNSSTRHTQGIPTRTYPTLALVAGVATPPDPPSSVSASAMPQSARVSWDTAASKLDSTSFKVESVPSGHGCEVKGAISCVVTGLTPGTSYRFQVTASNYAGSSEPSSLSNSVIPRKALVAPGAVRQLKGTPLKGQVLWTWLPPLNKGGAQVVWYEYRLGEGAWKKFTGTKLTVNGKAGKPIMFRIRSVNPAGAGPVAKLIRSPKK